MERERNDGGGGKKNDDEPRLTMLSAIWAMTPTMAQMYFIAVFLVLPVTALSIKPVRYCFRKSSAQRR